MNVQPWSTLGPAGSVLVIRQGTWRPTGAVTTAEVRPDYPPCPAGEHVEGWAGVGFPQHPVVVVRLCVRCWQVFEAIDRGE